MNPVARHGAALLSAGAFAALFLWAISGAWARAVEGRVVHVADGDSVTVRTSTREYTVRLLYIDAPEYDQPHGREAKRHLESLVRLDRVRLETRGKDRYGRTLGHLERAADGLDINYEQVARGHAWANARGAERTRYEAAEAKARRHRWGLWRAARPVPPKTWRRDHAR